MQVFTHAATTPPPVNTARMITPNDAGLWGNLGVAYCQNKRYHYRSVICDNRRVRKSNALRTVYRVTTRRETLGNCSCVALPPASMQSYAFSRPCAVVFRENSSFRHSGNREAIIRNPQDLNQVDKHSDLLDLIKQGTPTNKIIKVGIVWTGSLTFKANDQRRLPLTAFLPLSEQPNLRLYSLQKGPAIKELYATGADAYIQDIGKLCEDFADTAAAIEQMDVIVMTDSSVAHLAGSLNKKIINLLNDRPYWLYALEKDRTPWYPNMALIHREQINELTKSIIKIN